MRSEIVLLGPENERPHMMRIASEQNTKVYWVNTENNLETIVENCQEAIVIISKAGGFFNVELARKCPHLKLFQRLGSGTDNIPIAEIAEMGIAVANNAGGNSSAVAEHTIALIVGVYRKLHLQILSVKERTWQGNIKQRWSPQSHELTGKTIGIVGGGYIGRQVAQRLKGWDIHLVYYDIVTMSKKETIRLNIKWMDLDELLRISDIVTLHVPYFKSTHHLIGNRELSLMKPTSILINTGRGSVIDEAALTNSLRNGTIAGAGLDVLEIEPPLDDNPLLDMENVMVTPHIAGAS